MKGTPVSGRVSTGMAGRTVRLAVWAWFPRERTSRWSYAHPVTTGRDGTFSTVLSFDNGFIGKRTWRVESNYASIPMPCSPPARTSTRRPGWTSPPAR